MSALPTITRIRPNFTAIAVNGITYYFSYATCVAFFDNKRLHVCENIWSKTTGKHLNYLQNDKSKRIPYEKFQEILSKVK